MWVVWWLIESSSRTGAFSGTDIDTTYVRPQSGNTSLTYNLFEPALNVSSEGGNDNPMGVAAPAVEGCGDFDGDLDGDLDAGGGPEQATTAAASTTATARHTRGLPKM